MSTPGYSAISSYSRVEILHLLQVKPERSVTELCAATKLHANTVREHLQRLIESGYVVSMTERRTTRGRPRVLYSAADGSEGAASPVATRKARDAARRGDLMRRIMPETTGGELPAAAVHQLDALVEDLTDAGFDPLVDEKALTVDLSPCPLVPQQSPHRDTLCRVHLGLMDSVLATASGPLRTRCIIAAQSPEACVVQLAMSA